VKNILRFKNVVIIGALLSYISVSQAIEVDQKIPEIELATTHGTVSLSSFRNQYFYLLIWDSTCDPCKGAIGMLNHLYSKTVDLPLKILGVNVDGDYQNVQLFLRKNPVNFPLAFDNFGTAISKFYPKQLPIGYLIKPDGTIAKIDTVFDESAVETFQSRIQQIIKPR
jgi:peroxiredoxin